jgi:type VI secretion system ImpB/VipA family protein
MADSIQHKIGRNRPPRVQITYDVEIGDAIEKTEIPFVVGIMADLSGLGDAPRPDKVQLKDKERPFVEIDRDNFTDVMAKVAPRLAIDGALDHEGKKTKDGCLVFKSPDDFGPEALVERIEQLKAWQDERAALRDVLTKLDSNDAFYEQVREWVKRNDKKKFTDLKTGAEERLIALKSADAQSPAQEVIA